MASVNTEAGASRDLKFPNYKKEYRGLPTEIRMMIWRYALSDELHVNAIIADSDSVQRQILQQKPSEVWWYAVADIFNFNFSIFLLNKQTQLEAMSVSKGTINWVLDEGVDVQTCTALLSSLSPLQKHITRSISIATTSIAEYSLTIVAGPQDNSLKSYLARDIAIIAEIPHVQELTLRLIRPAIPSRNPIHLGVHFMFDEDKFVEYGQIVTFPQLHALLGGEMALMGWYDEQLIAVHSAVIGGKIPTIRIEHDSAFEGLRQCLTPPTDVLFKDSLLANYPILSLAEIDHLDVQLDWPASSRRFVIRITKKETSGE